MSKEQKIPILLSDWKGGGGGEITAIISLGIDLLSGFVPLTKSVINI